MCRVWKKENTLTPSSITLPSILLTRLTDGITVFKLCLELCLSYIGGIFKGQFTKILLGEYFKSLYKGMEIVILFFKMYCSAYKFIVLHYFLMVDVLRLD